MRTIQIGIEVHKSIEAERRALDESENDILMRLLKIPAPPKPIQEQLQSLGRSWVKDGVDLPSGSVVRVVYSGQTLEGVIEDGRWLVNGQLYDSPSMALIHNVTTAQGNKTNLNGWNHWAVKRPQDSRYRRISELRALAAQG